MSWTQGIQLVEDMEPEAIKIAQRYAPEGETVACLVWEVLLRVGILSYLSGRQHLAIRQGMG
jgi:hypothetical protein